MTSAPQKYDVVILGGGAAGLMCALTAGQRNKRVLVIEISNKLGKKILMSGGGRCNFTNLEIQAENFLCNNPHFVKSALSQYTQWDFIALMDKYDVAYHEKGLGQLFCDVSAKDVLSALRAECHAGNVDFILDCSVDSVSHLRSFDVVTDKGEFSAANLVVATGGLSIPTLGGASGLGYQLAAQFGLPLNATDASLVPLTLTGKWRKISKSLAGVSVPVEVSVPQQGFAEGMLFTHRGLSGPAILQISNYWQLGEIININLLPRMDVSEQLIAAKKTHPNKTVMSWLWAHLPKALVNELAQEWWPGSIGQPLHEYKNEDLQALANMFNAWNLKPSGSEGYRTAEVTRGGVDVAAISSKTMQVKSQEGLYFIGEVLDVTGHLGGYNFQWAWSSGFVAGSNV